MPLKNKISVILISLCLLIIVSGCNDVSPPEYHHAADKVNAYIEYSSINAWDKVVPLLSGQALIEAERNIPRVNNNNETVTNKLLTVTWQNDAAAEVYADVTTNSLNGYNRKAYKFYLVKQDADWKIYRSELSDFMRPNLNYGQLPQEVSETIQEYFNLTTTEKRNQDTKYLAGKLLMISLSSKQIQGSQQIASEDAQRILNITPVGVSDDYVIAKVLYEHNGRPATAMIDLINVMGNWKIVQLDIIELNI